MRVINHRTGKPEDRVLEEVYYSENAPANLISMNYMQSKAGFFLHFLRDQRTLWLEKKGLKLKFKKIDGLYRMCVPRLRSVSFFVTVKNLEDPKGMMRLLHQRFDHASMANITKMAGDSSVTGINNTINNFANYECLSCMSSKLKRMSYKNTKSH